MIAHGNDMLIGETPVAELARVYGTPLVAIDVRVLNERIRRFERVAAACDVDVAYAGKALLPVALARRLAESTISLDVCSIGELTVAERGGMPAARIVLHGCGKRPDEIAAAAAGRVGRVVADHMPELVALAVAASPASRVRVLVRCNPGVESDTHAMVRTSGDGTKFGFALGDLAAAVAFVRAAPGLEFVGVHTHLGSQLYDASTYLRAIDVMTASLAGVALPKERLQLVIGGGFGVDSHPGGRSIDIDAVIAQLAVRARERARELGIEPPRVGIEPGRAVVAEAGTTIYEVVAVKSHGERRFAIVDGSIADNPRPALYDAYHHPTAITGRADGELVVTTICGRACENDELVTAPVPADLRPGDLIALATAGAYVVPMASNYNRFVRPPLVFVDGKEHRAVVRRETIDDLLRCETPDG